MIVYRFESGGTVIACRVEGYKGLKILKTVSESGFEMRHGSTQVIGSVKHRGLRMYHRLYKLVQTPSEARVGEHLATEDRGDYGCSLDRIVSIEEMIGSA